MQYSQTKRFNERYSKSQELTRISPIKSEILGGLNEKDTNWLRNRPASKSVKKLPNPPFLLGLFVFLFFFTMVQFIGIKKIMMEFQLSLYC